MAPPQHSDALVEQLQEQGNVSLFYNSTSAIAPPDSYASNLKNFNSRLQELQEELDDLMFRTRNVGSLSNSKIGVATLRQNLGRVIREIQEE